MYWSGKDWHLLEKKVLQQKCTRLFANTALHIFLPLKHQSTDQWDIPLHNPGHWNTSGSCFGPADTAPHRKQTRQRWHRAEVAQSEVGSRYGSAGSRSQWKSCHTLIMQRDAQSTCSQEKQHAANREGFSGMVHSGIQHLQLLRCVSSGGNSKVSLPFVLKQSSNYKQLPHNKPEVEGSVRVMTNTDCC